MCRFCGDSPWDVTRTLWNCREQSVGGQSLTTVHTKLEEVVSRARRRTHQWACNAYCTLREMDTIGVLLKARGRPAVGEGACEARANNSLAKRDRMEWTRVEWRVEKGWRRGIGWDEIGCMVL